MKKVMGETKIEILRELLKGDYETPRGGFWTFFKRFGYAEAYTYYFYKHLNELIDDGYVAFDGRTLRITEKGKKLATSEIVKWISKNRVVVKCEDD